MAMEAAGTPFTVPGKGGFLGPGHGQANVTTTVIATPENQGMLSSAVQFAENAVQGAASLAAGVVITGAELYVGVGAKILDAAGNVVRRGVGAMSYVQERGHRATAGAVVTMKNTVNSVQQRGNEVLVRSASAVLPATVSEAAFGTEGYGTEARERVESGGGPAAGVFHGATQSAKQALGMTDELAETASEAVGKTRKKSAGAMAPVIKMGKMAATAVAGTIQRIEQQGEDAVETGLGTLKKGSDTARRAAHSAAGSAVEAVDQTRDFLREKAESVRHESMSTAEEVESAGEAAAASAFEHAKEGVEQTAAATRDATETARGGSRGIVGSMASAIGNIASTVKGTLKEVEKQGEDVISSPGAASSAAKESLSRPAEIIEGGVGLAAAKAKDTSAKGTEITPRRERQPRSPKQGHEAKVTVKAAVETKPT